MSAPPPPYSDAEKGGPYPPTQGYPPPQQGYPPPQQGYPPPQQGYPSPQQGYPPPQQGYPPVQAQTVAVVTTGPVCPKCNGPANYTENFTCCGICLAIVFFPIGLLCCLFMKERRCANCGAER